MMLTWHGVDYRTDGHAAVALPLEVLLAETDLALHPRREDTGSMFAALSVRVARCEGSRSHVIRAAYCVSRGHVSFRSHEE